VKEIVINLAMLVYILSCVCSTEVGKLLTKKVVIRHTVQFWRSKF